MTDIRGVVLDVDGTLVRGEQLVPGAASLIDRLEAAGIDFACLSNNPTRPPASYARKLHEIGLEIDPDRILTAGGLTARWLAESHSDASILVFGSEGLHDALSAQDCSITTDPNAADVVLASYDQEFDYDDMETALHALADDDVTFVGSDPDRTIPTEGRPIPGSGAIIAAIAGVSDREPGLVLGKPSSLARDAVLDRLGHPAEECLIVGDRLDTDIALAADSTLTSVLVRSGVTDETRLSDSTVTPDHVLDSVADLDQLLVELSG